MSLRPYICEEREFGSESMEPNRKRQKLCQSSTLGVDILSNILLLLPSLVSLARAALTCDQWRRLATSDDFLRRFRAAHPSPTLLGCFMSLVSSDGDTFRAFHRAKIRSDRDLEAAVGRGDFLLAGVHDDRPWVIRDCSHGVLLLASRDQLALFNPLSRRRINISCPAEFGDISFFNSCFLPTCGGDGVPIPSFRVVALERMSRRSRRVRAHVYTSHKGQWSSLAAAPASIKAPPPLSKQHQSSYPMHAAGRIYWKYAKGQVLLSLDTGSMEFSHVALPPVPVPVPQALYAVGETEDGACCLVCVVKPLSPGSALQVWLRDEEEAGSWKLENQVLSSGHACQGLDINKVRQVCAVTAGIVVFRVDIGFGRSRRCRYLAFRLKTLTAGPGAAGAARLPPEADFITCNGYTAYPYIFTWPSFPLLQPPPERLTQGGDAASDLEGRTSTSSE